MSVPKLPYYMSHGGVVLRYGLQPAGCSNLHGSHHDGRTREWQIGGQDWRNWLFCDVAKKSGRGRLSTLSLSTLSRPVSFVVRASASSGASADGADGPESWAAWDAWDAWILTMFIV